MSTLASELINEFDARWNEVDILLGMAEDLNDNDPKFQVICRATIVLIVANLEGYLNETLKCLIGDINSNNYFKNTSWKMKMTYCSQFFNSEEKNFEKRVKRLVEVLDDLDTKYSIEPFLFENNKNPKASVVEKLFSEISKRNFFSYITNCDVENVFQNNSLITFDIIEKLKNVLVTGVENFPYNIELENVGFNLDTNIVPTDCLWKVFLDQTLKARHSVAHGISQDNTMSLIEIKDTKEKIKVLELSFSTLVFKYALQGN